MCAETTVDAAARALTRHIVVFRGDAPDGTWRRVDESHEQRLYEPPEVLADLRAAGFAEATALDAWGALELRTGQTAFAARRAELRDPR